MHFVENPGICPEPLFLPSSTRRRKRSSKASHSEKQPSRWIFFHKRKKILKEKSGNTETHKYFFKQWRTQMHIWKWGHGQSSKSSWGDSPSKSLKETLKIVQNLIANEQWQKKKLHSCRWFANCNNNHGTVFSGFFQDRRSCFSVDAFTRN